MEKQKMNVKDLVNVGIFTVIYFVLFYICGMTGLVPFMAVFYTPLLALIAGIPCVLFFTKTEKFGMVTIMGVLMGLIIFLMGYGYYGLILGICCGLVADLIMKAGKYKSWKSTVSKQLVVHLSSARDNLLFRPYQNGSKTPENQGFPGFYYI